MKIKLFTDKTDMDGAGNYILAKLAFGKNADVEDCYYDDIDDKIIKFYESEEFKNYDEVYITDLSIKLETAEYIDSIKCHNLKIFDHHKTALELNKYKWCNIVVEDTEGLKCCGTYLYYIYLVNNEYLKQLKSLDDFVELVRCYDTWDWNRLKDLKAYNLNRIYKIYEREKFINSIIEKLSVANKYRVDVEIISSHDIELINLFEEKLQSDIDKKNKSLLKINIDDYKTGVVFIDGNASEIGHGLLKLNFDLDAVAMIITDYNTISFRSRDDIDISKLAEKLGGGGHKNSAGCKFDVKLKNDFIANIFNKIK